MIIFINTSTSVCKISVMIEGKSKDYEWNSDRNLAKELLNYLSNILYDNNKAWSDIISVAVFKGPGSFTGLRIGITVANTLADSLNIPIVGEIGENWKSESIKRLESGQNDKLVLPFYGAEANITAPKK